MVLNDNPMCQSPGCDQPAIEVDHIVPRARGGEDTRRNLQSLCKMHHSRKTALHDGAFGRKPEVDSDNA